MTAAAREGCGTYDLCTTRPLLDTCVHVHRVGVANRWTTNSQVFRSLTADQRLVLSMFVDYIAVGKNKDDMPNESIFECLKCGKESPLETLPPRCPFCGSGAGIVRPANSERVLSEQQPNKPKVRPGH